MSFKHLVIFILFIITINFCESKSINKEIEEVNFQDTICHACNLLLPHIRELALKNRSNEINNLALFFCSNLKIADKDVCGQLLDSYLTSVIYVATDSPLNNTELCSAAFLCGPISNPAFNWNITLPKVPKPPVVPRKLPKEGSPTIRILQLTDIHIDFEYQPGSLADCNQPLCCRNTSTGKSQDKVTKDKLAGYWGDYRNCDVPVWTVENMFQHIVKYEQFDFIYWTGDLPSHNVWNQTKSDQLNALDKLTGLFKKYFSDKIIYPTLGNHEATPSNLFPTPFTPQDNITWLYNKLAQDWTQTGLPIDLKENITKGAFYTLLLYPGVRLISMNMNYCYNLNFWLYINSTDPLDQLKWLANILQESENKNEKVHIIGHVNPSTCLKSWSLNYYKIINRYESTIAGQFFGHKHNDYFEMFYDLQNITRPVGIAYLSGSTTTYSFLNPSYRIYTVDGFYKNTTWEVLDYETTIMNVTDANLSNNPKWIKEYSVMDDYNMTSLFPENWDNLLKQALTNLNGPLTKKIIKHFYNSYDSNKTCDSRCKKNLICKFKQALPDSFIPC